MNILLTDSLQRKTLAATRSLGKSGENVFVAESTRFNATAFSKYASKFILSPNPNEDAEAYFNWLLEAVNKYDIDLLIPMDNASMEIVVSRQEALKKITKVLIPAYEDYLVATDKGNAVKCAMDAGVQTPKSHFVNSFDELLSIEKKLKFPIVIKPRRSWGSRGIRIINDWQTLLSTYQDITKEYENPILQEYIPQGTRYDVCLLFDDRHHVTASFVQKELRQFPEPIGPSTIQESTKQDQLLAASIKMMSQLSWVGIAELEFMENPENQQFYFMEINTRFWASLQCAIFSGVDFPLLYKKAAFNEHEVCHDYQLGIKCRWLFPGDLLRLLTEGRRVKWIPPFWVGKRQGVLDDTFDLDDPMVMVGFTLSVLRYLFDIKMWKAIFWR